MVEAAFLPYLISWNTTQRCNLRCKHCYLDSSELTAGSEKELSTDKGLRFIDELASLAPGAMLVLTGGEPLLRRDIFDLAKHASALGLNVVVGSNGTLLDDDVAERLVESGVSGVGISLDSLEAGKHDSFRGIKGAWEKAVRSIEACKKAGLDFQLQTTATRENYTEIPGLIEFASAKGARAFNLFFLVCTGRGEKMTDLSPGEYDDLLRYLADNQGNCGDMMVRARCAPHFARFVHQKTSHLPLIKGCLAGTNYCRITPEGDVTPCPYLPISLGNIKEKSFAEIWEEAGVLKELRKHKLKGKCGGCEYSEACGGCRARAYATTGDYLDEDAWCMYRPGGGRVIRINSTAEKKGVTWSEEARRRMERVPPFVRGAVVKLVERYAIEKGCHEVTPEVMAEARKKFRR